MIPNVLTIAGSDPTGAAGLQADLAVFRDLGVHGLSVITAVVAQNTAEVLSYEAVKAKALTAQLEALSDDAIPIASVKIGMLPTPELVDAVASWRATHPETPFIVDTVLASGSGRVMLAEQTMTSLRGLIRHATVITPNIPEALALVGPHDSLNDLAHAVKSLTTGAVLLKGGHDDTPKHGSIIDIWCDQDGPIALTPMPRIRHDVRGTGCQLSSAIAAGIANGLGPRQASEEARAYLNQLLRHNANQIGNGRSIIIRTPPNADIT